MRSIPQHCTPTTQKKKKKKKSCGIRVGPDLFGMVGVLGYGSSLVGEESSVWQFIVES